MASKRKPNYLKLLLQWGVVSYLLFLVLNMIFGKSSPDFEAYCPFGGLQALGSFFRNNTLACSMTTVQIGMGVALLAGVVIFSKLFCSFLCPLGTITEWLGLQARRLKIQFTLSGTADRPLRLLKYALLFATTYFTLTSSELFCRTFDPFYASVTGFSGDVVWYYALPALILTVVGSFFIRQFWCKYLCPLGAITNLGVYVLPSVAWILFWVILNFSFGITVSWVWLLAAICLTGFVLEAFTMRFLVFPTMKITRNADICTSCRICDKKCPMACRISDVDKVQHIDCHLCTDCIVKCPEKGALTINRKPLQWLPALVAFALFTLALILANKYELPTINERWGSQDELENASIFEMSGLKNIKCFGSSRAFANQMKEVDGVLGVETFVKHHRVKIFYNPDKLSEMKVKEAIFSPFGELFKAPGTEMDRVNVFETGVDRCFDPKDQTYLLMMLKAQEGILAMETEFGEPVTVKVYYDSALVQPEGIRNAINARKVILQDEQGFIEQPVDFEVNSRYEKDTIVTTTDFYLRFFETQDMAFNNSEKYVPEQLSDITLPFPQLTDYEIITWIPHLISHTSNDDGIVRFTTFFNDKGPFLRLRYVKSLTYPDKIMSLLNEPKLLVHYPDKSEKTFDNPFEFRLTEE